MGMRLYIFTFSPKFSAGIQNGDSNTNLITSFCKARGTSFSSLIAVKLPSVFTTNCTLAVSLYSAPLRGICFSTLAILKFLLNH